MIGNLSTSLTKPRLPTLAQIERRRHELLTQAGLHSQHQTSPGFPRPGSAANEGAPHSGTAPRLRPAPPIRGA